MISTPLYVTDLNGPYLGRRGNPRWGRAENPSAEPQLKSSPTRPIWSPLSSVVRLNMNPPPEVGALAVATRVGFGELEGAFENDLSPRASHLLWL